MWNVLADASRCVAEFAGRLHTDEPKLYLLSGRWEFVGVAMPMACGLLRHVVRMKCDKL